MSVSAALAQTGPTESQSAAVDAYIYGYPLVTMELTRRSFTNVAQPDGKSAPIGYFVNVPKYPPASDKRVTAPNADTLYSTAWIDVVKEPYILHVPDEHGRYYLMPMLDGRTTCSPTRETYHRHRGRRFRHHRAGLEGDVAAGHQGRIQVAHEDRLGARPHLFDRYTGRLCRRQRHPSAIQADPAQCVGQTDVPPPGVVKSRLGHEGPGARSGRLNERRNLALPTARRADENQIRRRQRMPPWLPRWRRSGSFQAGIRPCKVEPSAICRGSSRSPARAGVDHGAVERGRLDQWVERLH